MLSGADPSMGLGSDYQAMSVWDVTNTFDIKQVASLYENEIEPRVFAYILVKTAILYNNALIAIENNGVSQVTVTAIWQDFEYDNVLCEGGGRTSIGIASSSTRKMKACLNFKSIFEDPSRNVEINDGRLIGEIEKFEKKDKSSKTPSYEAADGHDDFMMATVWAFFALVYEICERYFDIKKSIMTKFGEQQPLFIQNFEQNGEYGEAPTEKEQLENVDKAFSMFSSEYDKELQGMKKEISEQVVYKDIDKFLRDKSLDNVKVIDEDNYNASSSPLDTSKEDFGFNFF